MSLFKSLLILKCMLVLLLAGGYLPPGSEAIRCFECHNCSLSFGFDQDLITECPNTTQAFAVCRVSFKIPFFFFQAIFNPIFCFCIFQARTIDSGKELLL